VRFRKITVDAAELYGGSWVESPLRIPWDAKCRVIEDKYEHAAFSEQTRNFAQSAGEILDILQREYAHCGIR